MSFSLNDMSSKPISLAAPPQADRLFADLPVGRWRRRLDTLRVKLFLAIFGANFVLVMAAYLIYSWSFDKGLTDYLNQAEEARLTPMVTRLAEGYRQHGSWEWIRQDRERWFAMLRETIGIGQVPRRRDDGRVLPSPQTSPQTSSQTSPQASSQTPGPLPRQSNDDVVLGGALARIAAPDIRSMPPLTMDWRMLLFDPSQRILIGSPGRSSDSQIKMKPIMVGDMIVGYLGYIPRLEMVESIETVASKQQSRRFGAIAIGMIAAVLLNAALISYLLARRLRALGDGAAALARGDYATRIPARGNDELAQLAGDFNHLAHALEAARRARQQWIADIAHELRTPLATLRAEVEALVDGVRPLSQKSLASLAQEVGHLTRLVDDLRMLSLSDLGALTYYKEPVHLAEIVEDSITAARGAIEEKGLDVQLALQSDVQVLADGERLQQVFANLLQNTLRYSDAPARLEVRLRSADGVARLTWDDTSPGVPAADLARLTERLFRVDGSRARASGGSGLGLAIVKAIVDAHGGHLEPSVSPIGGLRWTLTLPLLPARA
uniref:histidine kinase n=1 Tax=uncultured bacterium BLR8 TaxID=506524 RepID=C0IN89_9BACT|nr:periplasmic sensor signal transduction histidine kinase [uncultured bacterium BLR8]